MKLKAMLQDAQSLTAFPLRSILANLLLLAAAMFLSACDNDQKPVTPIDMQKRVPSAQLQVQPTDQTGLRVGIGAMITPKDGYIYYQRLIDYLEDRLGTTIQVIDKGTYEEFNQLLKDEELDLAFVCSGSYVDGKDNFDLDLLVVPETLTGESVYYSYLVVPVTSEAKTLADLKQKRFAFTDPLSNSGRLSPVYQIVQMGADPSTFFSETTFTYAHDRSVKAVAAGLVDGAAVDSLIYEQMKVLAPDVIVKTKVIAHSEPYGIPPVVVRPQLPPVLRERLKNIFLDLHEDPAGKTILKGMMLRRYVIGRDSDYDNVRKMRDFTQ